jgi:hypothetical protein
MHMLRDDAQRIVICSTLEFWWLSYHLEMQQTSLKRDANDVASSLPLKRRLITGRLDVNSRQEVERTVQSCTQICSVAYRRYNIFVLCDSGELGGSLPTVPLARQLDMPFSYMLYVFTSGGSKRESY